MYIAGFKLSAGLAVLQEEVKTGIRSAVDSKTHKEKEVADFRRIIYALAVLAVFAAITMPSSGAPTRTNLPIVKPLGLAPNSPTPFGVNGKSPPGVVPLTKFPWHYRTVKHALLREICEIARTCMVAGNSLLVYGVGPEGLDTGIAILSTDEELGPYESYPRQEPRKHENEELTLIVSYPCRGISLYKAADGSILTAYFAVLDLSCDDPRLMSHPELQLGEKSTRSLPSGSQIASVIKSVLPDIFLSVNQSTNSAAATLFAAKKGELADANEIVT